MLLKRRFLHPLRFLFYRSHMYNHAAITVLFWFDFEGLKSLHFIYSKRKSFSVLRIICWYYPVIVSCPLSFCLVSSHFINEIKRQLFYSWYVTARGDVAWWRDGGLSWQWQWAQRRVCPAHRPRSSTRAPHPHPQPAPPATCPAWQGRLSLVIACSPGHS